MIRFIASDGKTYFGDVILQTEQSDPRLATQAYKVIGDIFNQHQVTDEILSIEKLVPPLDHTFVHTVRMIGMNYKKHAIEINLPIPQYPCLFYKPVSALSGPLNNISVPKVAQIEDVKIDYEAELVVIIGKQGRDIPEHEALNHVLGYSAGNDVSQRTWQIERGGSQFSTGKMFDSWAPIGPAIVSPEVIQDPNDLKISSKINGEIRQNSTTNDMIFNVKKLISFLSQGTTLLPGDVLFTGTPQGVGSGFKPSKWLKNGDTVEIAVEKIGTIQNKVKFE